MSNLTNPPGGGDPPDRFRNVGEQIQSFFDFAENNPDQAVPFFVNIWETQASLTTRALALQGLGVAAQHYHVKEALADWDVLRDIAKEVKGKGEVSNDLTRWAAASALEAIGYSQQSLQHLEGGGFTEPLDRIRREIRDRKLAEINRIQRLNSRGETTAEYERHLEFWIYGPADELLNGNENSRNYADIVGDVISKLHGRGVYLGLISPNSIVQGTALRQAGLIFKESAEIEEYLYGLLEEFLDNSNHETSLRIKAAEIINTATNVNRKLKTLSKLLLEYTELRNTAVRLLNSYKRELVKVETDAYTVLDTLTFEYGLDKPEPKDLTISQIESIIASSERELGLIPAKFTTAIGAAESLGRKYGKSPSVLKQFLQNKQDEYLSDIEIWIPLLRNQISETAEQQRKVQSNQSLLTKTIYLMSNSDCSEARQVVNYPKEIRVTDENFLLHRTDFTYNQSQTIQKDLKSLKFHLIQLFAKIESELKGILNNLLKSISDNFLQSQSLDNSTPIQSLFILIILFFIHIFLLLLSLSDLINKDNSRSSKRDNLIQIAIGLSNLSIIIIVAANYQLILNNYGPLAVLIIVTIIIMATTMTMGIIMYFFYFIDKKRVDKQIKEAQSILYNLNTQWKE